MSNWPYPRIIAHRGGGRFAPENTLAAIRTGHAMGFHGVEFDVMLASDARPVLIHDETLERTTDGSGQVAATPLDVLATLDAGSWFDASFKGEAVPGFEAAAALCISLGLWANVEIKPATGHDKKTGYVAATTAMRVWNGVTPQPLLSSFSSEALQAARDAAPDLPRGLLFDAVPADWQEKLKTLECVSLHCNSARLDESTAHAIIAAGYGLAVWTVNDPALATRLFAWGVDAIFTDRLDLIGADFAA